MKSSVAHLIFLASMLILLDCVLCYNYGRDEDPSLEERVDRLEDKVEILTNEMEKLLSEDSGNSEKNLNETEGEPIQQPGITVLEVRREEEGEMIRFTVKYDSGEETVETQWMNYIAEEEYNGITTAVGEGVYETTALVPRPPQDEDNDNNSNGNFSYFEAPRLWLSLELPDFTEGLNLELNLIDDDAVERDIPTPRLEIEPAGDFVYQEGEEFSFKLRISRTDDDGPSSRMGNMHISAVILDPRSGKVSLNYDDDDVFQIGEKKKFQNYEEVIVGINGTESGISGLVHFSSRKAFYDGDVVRAVQRGKLVILRPSTQEGPFPDGYLGVVEKPNDMRYGHAASLNGDDQFVCTLGEDCHYECMVAGDDISDVTVKRLKADGASQTLAGKELGRIMPNLRHKAVTFHVDSIPEEPDRILCVANNAEGRSISKEVSILVTTPVSIVVEDSHIVMVSRDENKAVFEIACTVKGNPQPNVTFNIYGPDSLYDEKPDVTLDRGDDMNAMVKYVTYDIEEVNKSWFSLTADCSANRNDPYWGYDYHSMTYDPNDSENLQRPLTLSLSEG